MLKQRILTALVLLIVFGAALWAPMPAPFMLLTLLLVTAAQWEWSRLVGGRKSLNYGVFGVLVIFSLIVPYFNLGDWLRQAHWPEGVHPGGPALWLYWCPASLLWIIGGPWLLRRGVARWPDLPLTLRQFVGQWVLFVAWFSLVSACMMGINFLLSTLALVWAADTAAYFVGRALGGKFTGGRKLAPSISPGKSWEGAAGGFIGVLLTGAIWIGVDRAWQLPPSLYTIFWQRGAVWFVGALALLTVMSVVGDLTESLVKRAAGVKDSSNLLPGHGGVLDRIDALLPTLPLAMLLVTIGSSPA